MRAPLTPLQAFIHDAEKLGNADLAPVDEARLSHWLAVAQAAERLATLAPNDRPEYLNVLGNAVLPARAGRPTQIEGDGRAPMDGLGQLAERLRLEAEDMERASCFELALATVSAVCQLLAKGESAGRWLATVQLGRVNRQMGNLESADDCYRTVAEDAEASHDGPVASHGYIGLGNVAHARGNRPAQKRFFDSALRLAAKGSPAELSAHQGLLNVAMALGQLGDALLHGWRAHDLALPNSEVQMETVFSMASIAREAGFMSAALAGSEFVVKNATQARLRLPALGGAIRAAARTGDAAAVERFEQLGHTFSDQISQPFEVSRFLLWSAESWSILGDHARVTPLIHQALRIAEQYGFHEIAIRAEELNSNATKALRRSSIPTAAWQDDAAVQIGIGRLEALSVR